MIGVMMVLVGLLAVGYGSEYANEDIDLFFLIAGGALTGSGIATAIVQASRGDW